MDRGKGKGKERKGGVKKYVHKIVISRRMTLEMVNTVQGNVMSLRCKNGKEKFKESVHTSGKGERTRNEPVRGRKGKE
jgi:hypothetical protein